MPASKPNRKPSQRFLITTLGCKVNQAEAAWLAHSLEALGWSRVDDPDQAEAAVVLTCAVTAAASRQSRQAARRLGRALGPGRVLVTGCDAQAEAEAFAAEGFPVMGRAGLASLPQTLAQGGPLPASDPPPPPDSGGFCPGFWPPDSGRARSQLKVQDGCDAGCAYCIVPSTRGRPRSLNLSEAVATFRDLGEAGAAEVVLTGIHLGLYGRDLDQAKSVADLVRALLAAHPGPRLRLSSLEVNEVSDEILGLMAGEERLCRHLHIPLQSGADQVLAAMGRPYDTAFYAERARAALGAVDGLCLGADVLAGLPGEDQAAFEHTRDLLASLDLAYLHVFPYSPRPGTRAAQMKRPNDLLAREWAAQLRALGRAKRIAFLQKQIGQTLHVVVEGSGQGRSGNYCLVEVDRAVRPGGLVAARIESLVSAKGEPRLKGRIIDAL